MRKTAAPRVELDEDAHIYRVNGEIWPSVTDICDRLQQFNGVPRDVLERAARFGRHVHEACHLDCTGALDEDDLDPALRPFVDAWRKWRHDFKARIVVSEHVVVAERYRYCGKLDVIVDLGGRLELIDWKATAAIPRTVGPQTAAYAHAYGVPGMRRRVVQLLEDGTYRSRRLTDPRDWSYFCSALNLAQWFRS